MTTLIFTNAVTVCIIAMNYVLKQIAMILITWIGYDTYSELMVKITNGIFIVLFFNTGLLLTLVNANLSDVSMSEFLSSIFDGRYYDYSSQWYAKVGYTIV